MLKWLLPKGKKTVNTQEIEENRYLTLRDEINKLNLTVERFDNELIQKLINRHTELSQEVTEIRNTVRLLDEMVDKYMHRESARNRRTDKPKTKEGELSEEEKDAFIAEALKNGNAVPIGPQQRVKKKRKRFVRTSKS